MCYPDGPVSMFHEVDADPDPPNEVDPDPDPPNEVDPNPQH